MSLTLEQALQHATRLFDAVKSPSSRIDAVFLLCHVLDKPSSYLYTWPEKSLSIEETSLFNALVERRQKGEPIAYIMGYRDFWSLRLHVEPSTLIPRPDTESLVEFALTRLPKNKCTVLDLGTGTGAIALALAKEREEIQVLGVDIRHDAVALAKRNAIENEIENVHFVQSNWFEGIFSKNFSMIVSNPPYIDPQDPHLLQGDVRFEPQSALISDENGLADIRHICTQSTAYLQDKGWLLIEHGYNQGDCVRELFLASGFAEVETLQDDSGHDRVTVGRLLL